MLLVLHAIDHLLPAWGAAVLHHLLLLLMLMFLNRLVNAWQCDAHIVRRLLLLCIGWNTVSLKEAVVLTSDCVMHSSLDICRSNGRGRSSDNRGLVSGRGA